MKTIDDLRTIHPLGGGRIVILSDMEDLKARRIEGTQVLLIGEDTAGLAAILKMYLEKEEVADAARRLGISAGTVHRLRKAFGLTEEYDGSSTTTRWRRETK